MTEASFRIARRFVAVVVLAASLGAALSIDSLAASKASKSVLSRELNLFGEVINEVHAHYVDVPNDKTLITGAINGMLAALDPHSSYMSAEDYEKMSRDISGEFGGVGLVVEADRDGLRIVTVIAGTPASKSALKTNDVIVKINGEPSMGMPLEKAVALMQGTPGSQVTLTAVRKGVDAPISVTLKRAIIRISPVEQRAEGKVSYIKVATFNELTAKKFADAIAVTKRTIGADLKGYILDLRNNPGGLLDQAVAVSSEVLTNGGIVSIKGRTWADTEVYSADSVDMTNAKPIVVLINGGTASAAEIVAGALQDDKRAIIVGTRSFGKGTVQTVLPLGAKRGALSLTTGRYFTPSGRSIQAKGIDPDVIVEEKVPDSVKESAAADFITGGERALPNHLKNPNESGADTKGATSIPYVPGDPKDDTQLRYALDFLNKLPDGAIQADVPSPSTDIAAKAAPPPP